MYNILSVRFINAVTLKCSAQTPHSKLDKTNKHVKEMFFDDNFVKIIDNQDGVNFIPMVNIGNIILDETPEAVKTVKPKVGRPVADK